MKSLNNKFMKKFIDQSLEKLKGEWVVIGGTVLPLLGVDYRVTVDIDMANISNSSTDDTIKLMELAEELGLPVEAINAAGAFFLHKQKGFKKNLECIAGNKKCKIYIPKLELYIKLKLSRLSESDFTDCIEYIKYMKRNKYEYDAAKIKAAITSELNKVPSKQKYDYLARLLQSI